MSAPSESSGHASRVVRGLRSAQFGLVLNAVLATVKIVAGVLGNAYALIADGIESCADIVSSLVVWRGLRLAEQGPDDAYHFGYGKAEAVAAAVVGIFLLGAALAIAAAGVRQFNIPHAAPEAFTLPVLLLVFVIKEAAFRWMNITANEIESTALRGDAWHHRIDAFTSLIAAIGIGLSLYGGPGWENADEIAAIIGSAVIFRNGTMVLRQAISDLMDRAPDATVISQMRSAACGVPGVLCIEKLSARKSGLGYFVDIHVQADGALPLRDAHVLGGKVKRSILSALPQVRAVLVHMEPFEKPTAAPNT